MSITFPIEWHKAKYIPFDLESTPLQIKTDSTTGSDDEINVLLYEAGTKIIAGFYVKFSQTMQYSIRYCSSIAWTDLPTQPPDDVDKIWTFTKTSTAFIISCNGVEVLNYVFSDSSNSDCVPNWSRDVEKIGFYTWNEFAPYYYIGPISKSGKKVIHFSVPIMFSLRS